MWLRQREGYLWVNSNRGKKGPGREARFNIPCKPHSLPGHTGLPGLKSFWFFCLVQSLAKHKLTDLQCLQLHVCSLSIIRESRLPCAIQLSFKNSLDCHLLQIYTANGTENHHLSEASRLLFPSFPLFVSAMGMKGVFNSWVLGFTDCLRLSLGWQGYLWFPSSATQAKAAQASKSSRNICLYLLLFLGLNSKYGTMENNMTKLFSVVISSLIIC